MKWIELCQFIQADNQVPGVQILAKCKLTSSAAITAAFCLKLSKSSLPFHQAGLNNQVCILEKLKDNSSILTRAGSLSERFPSHGHVWVITKNILAVICLCRATTELTKNITHCFVWCFLSMCTWHFQEKTNKQKISF